MHQYLRYLESVGFAGAPRVLGIEQGREVLTYIQGDVAVDPDWQPGHGHRLPAHARTDLALIGGSAHSAAAHCARVSAFDFVG